MVGSEGDEIEDMEGHFLGEAAAGVWTLQVLHKVEASEELYFLPNLRQVTSFQEPSIYNPRFSKTTPLAMDFNRCVHLTTAFSHGQ